jgi:hypothetical protein
MKWKIYGGKIPPIYFSPLEGKILLLKNCKLHNNKRVADLIFRGSHKTVCAWVAFTDYQEVTLPSGLPLEKIRFNPREKPFWASQGSDVDGQLFPELFVIGNEIFKLNV